MKINNFEEYLNEGLKSTIVKRLQKEPYTKSEYRDGKYVDETRYKKTQGFDSLANYYDLEKLDDSYFVQITKDQATKKPYNNDYKVFCFKNGKFIGLYHGTSVISEGGYGYRRKRENYSRKSLIEDSDELWAFDIERADKEITRGTVGKPRQDARSGSDAEYLSGIHRHQRYNNTSVSGARSAFADQVKKDNLNRYYQIKSKNLDFSDVHDLLQLKLKKAYKQLAHTIEDSKHNPEKSEYNLEFPKADPVLEEIIKNISYDKPAGNITNIVIILKKFHELMAKLKKIEKGEYIYTYGDNKTPANQETVNKLKYIQKMLRKGEEGEQ